MPPTTSKPAPKRKAPTFKPPRPAPKSSKTFARRKPGPPKKRGRPSFIANQASASEGDNDDEEDKDQNQYESDEDDEIPSADNVPTNTHTNTQDPPPTIPPALLTRLLHHHFKDGKMRLGKDANGVVGKYMETFVREAIARAAFERNEAAGKEGVGGGGGGGAGEFLEVEDLEKLAPQLLLDF